MTRQCSGCSNRFEFLPDGMRCGICRKRPSRVLEDYGVCKGCANAFEFLDAEKCVDCVAYGKENGLQQTAREAVSNPANPRTHMNVQRPRSDSDDERREEALRIVQSIDSSYGNAVSRAAPGAKVAPNKLKGAMAPPPARPVKKIHFKIAKVTNYDRGKYKAGPKFNPVIFTFPEDAKMGEVLEKVRLVVDDAYTATWKKRIEKIDEMTIMWAANQVVVDVDYLSGTVRELWRHGSANPLFVKPAQLKTFSLDWHVVIDFVPPKPRRTEDDDYEESEEDEAPKKSSTGTKRSIAQRKKRANSTAVDALRTTFNESARYASSSQPKKPRVITTSRGAYSTKIQDTTSVMYIVTKGVWSMQGDSATWVEGSERLTVMVEKNYFAEGVTKRAFKLRFKDGNHPLCAAKSFYNIGPKRSKGRDEVSREDNHQYLQEELLVQALLSQSIQRFSDAASKLQISVYQLAIPESYLLTVAEGTMKGTSMLVDELYENATFRKFSGTDEAGYNTEDLVGLTCDAFAHFSFYESEASGVFVDIQGIDTAKLPLVARKGRAHGHKLVLFDVMMHSVDLEEGIGNLGETGLEHFADQHICNTICKALGLPPADKMWSDFLFSHEDDALKNPVSLSPSETPDILDLDDEDVNGKPDPGANPANEGVLAIS